MNVAVIGASGYTGLELVKILVEHPNFKITYIANSEGGVSLSELHPSLKDVIELDVQMANAREVAKVAGVAFLALPHKTAMSFARELLILGIKVVDLSADYRLELDTYEKHYCVHEDRGHLGDAVYGLPEFYAEEIKKSKLVANPGCYPTASLLGLLPFADMIEKNSQVFIDAKSGVSGAGKKLSDTTHFVNVNENIFAYNPLKHRHAPEIKEKVLKLTENELNINFVPHLIPVSRGMLVSIYVTLKEEIDPIEVLNKFYEKEEFVRVREEPVNIKNTAGTNFCDIYAQCNGKALFISSSIDNLLRGASSQAVLNANLMCGFKIDEGISKIAYVP